MKIDPRIFPIPRAKEENWRDDALCAQYDPSMFFPEKGIPASTAKKICEECPVRNQCLAFALKNSEAFGIWGGMTSNQRAQFARENNIDAATAARLDRDAEILKMHKNKLDPETIARIIGVSERTVFRAVQRANKEAAEPKAA